MGRMLAGLLLGMMVMGVAVGAPRLAPGETESVGQQRLAYHQLFLVRALSRSGVSYAQYRDAVARARQYVGLLKGEGQGVVFMRRAMATYERALHVWSLKEESPYPVDSLRTDQPEGDAILGLCPAIPRFPYKFREQIYVVDAVSCIWGLAAQLLEQVPEDVR